MKKKIIGSVVISVIALSIIALVYFIENKTNNIITPKEMNKYFTKIEESSYYSSYGDKFIINSYEELKMHFPNAKISKDDFKNNKYLLIEIPYDSCAEEDIVPVDYSIENNNVTIIIQYKDKCGGPCAPLYIYYLLKIDKNQKVDNVDFKYKKTNNVVCHDDPYISKKPIIYLYPEEETNVMVKLKYPEKLTTTYPKYNDSWNVTAYPDGTLINNKTNRQLYGLYWEGVDNGIKQSNEGFVVRGEDTANFLEEKLAILGLNDKEAEEFIIYWLPVLEKNKFNYIKFSTEEEINKYMPIEVNPNPDTTIRIMMNYKPLTKKINVKEQKLVQKERNGFTLVEWGGSQIKD